VKRRIRLLRQCALSYCAKKKASPSEPSSKASIVIHNDKGVHEEAKAVGIHRQSDWLNAADPLSYEDMP